MGGFDPLLDDSVDFNTRIRRLGVPGELRIHRTLPHTFPSFPHWHVVPEVQHAMATTVTWLEAVLNTHNDNQPAHDEHDEADPREAHQTSPPHEAEEY